MHNSNSKIRGFFTVREILKTTGEVISEYTEENVITEQGINTMFLRMVLPDVTNDMKFSRFKLGIDYGLEEDNNPEWSMLNPKPAKKDYTSLNQYVVYDVPEGDMVFDYPDQNTFQAATLLDGKYILDTYYEDDVDLRYTSATLRFFNETTFSYKRFPVRSLSRMIDVQIIWTFKFVNEYDYLCPVPPYESQLRLYSVENGLRFYESAIDDGMYIIESSIVDADATVSSVKAQPNGDVYYFKNGKRLVRLDEAGTVMVDRVLNLTADVTTFDVDVFGNVYAGLNNNIGTVVKLDMNGDVIWTKNLSSGNQKKVTSIWVVNNNRFGVSTKDTVNFNPDTSGNMIHLLNNVTGDIIYLSSIDNGTGTTGYLELFSSSGGELFAIQKPEAAGKPSSLIKLAYDLSEIDRVVLDKEVHSAYAMHDNNICIGTGSGEGRLTKYNSDIEFIWDYVEGGTTGVKHISVDREGRVFFVTDTSVTIVTDELEFVATDNTSMLPVEISAVGSKWSYFG